MAGGGLPLTMPPGGSDLRVNAACHGDLSQLGQHSRLTALAPSGAAHVASRPCNEISAGT